MAKIILLIDDDAAVLETLNECLRPHYQTRIATLGQKGLDLARMDISPRLLANLNTPEDLQDEAAP